MENTSFKKYFLNVGRFSFSSSLPFEEMNFNDGSDLLRYAMDEESEDEGGTIAVFDDLELAKKELAKMCCRVDSTKGCGKVYQLDCEIPYLDQVVCDTDIKEYDSNCNYDIIKTVAVAELERQSEASRAEEIAEELRASRHWDMDLLEELCEIAGMEEEWKAALEEDDDEADEYPFEIVAFAAAEKLGVEIV